MPRTSKRKPDDASEELPFEAAIERLDAIVQQLEEGELDLEASLSAFEEGVALSKRCSSQLELAERRIEVLTREGGEWVARPFDENGAGQGEEGSEPGKEG